MDIHNHKISRDNICLLALNGSTGSSHYTEQRHVPGQSWSHKAETVFGSVYRILFLQRSKGDLG